LAAESQFRELIGDKDYRAMLGLAEALEREGVMYSESADAVQRGERPTTAPDRVARASEMRETARANWREAVEFYDRTLERKPGEIQAINGLQRVWALLGDYEQSLTWSKTLLEQSSSEIAFWRTQLERVGITADEEASLRRLLGASSKLLVETHLQASTLLFQLGRPEEALSHLDQVVAVEPDNVQAYGRRALLLHRLGRPKEARADIQEFMRLSTLSIDHPDMQRAIELLGKCEQELKAAPGGDAR
jgi:tetratricopeptide (TPR) repeat protein